MSEKVRVISQTAFEHRVREAAYFRSIEQIGDALFNWEWAERDQREFLSFYNIWVISDESFDVLVRFIAHVIWMREFVSRREEDTRLAESELRLRLGHKPSAQELRGKTRDVYNGRQFTDQKSDWRRARLEISGGLDIRGPWDDLYLESMVILRVTERVAA